MTTKAIISHDRTITKLDPNIVCSLRDADNCKMAGDYQLALNQYNKIIDVDPANAIALQSKADVLDLMGNFTEAIRCYETALECDPYNAEAWYNRGMTLWKTGRHEEGFESIRKGISLAMGEI
jgi:tetratricopeptide (TPR) repeat protein